VAGHGMARIRHGGVRLGPAWHGLARLGADMDLAGPGLIRPGAA